MANKFTPTRYEEFTSHLKELYQFQSPLLVNRNHVKPRNYPGEKFDLSRYGCVVCKKTDVSAYERCKRCAEAPVHPNFVVPPSALPNKGFVDPRSKYAMLTCRHPHCWSSTDFDGNTCRASAKWPLDNYVKCNDVLCMDRRSTDGLEEGWHYHVFVDGKFYSTSFATLAIRTPHIGSWPRESPHQTARFYRVNNVCRPKLDVQWHLIMNPPTEEDWEWRKHKQTDNIDDLQSRLEELVVDSEETG